MIYLIVVLICTSQNNNDVEHLSACLLTTCISSLTKCLLKSFALLLKVCLFVYREHEQREEKRKRERESLTDSMLSKEPNAGIHPKTLRS